MFRLRLLKKHVMKLKVLVHIFLQPRLQMSGQFRTTATLLPRKQPVGGIQCRYGRSGEENTLSSPYEDRTTNPLLLSLWCHYTVCAREAREQFGRRYSNACSQLAYWCHAYFYKRVLFYLKTRTVYNKPVLLLPSEKCAYGITKNIISAS